jgi:hypothetical protein
LAWPSFGLGFQQATPGWKSPCAINDLVFRPERARQ